MVYAYKEEHNLKRRQTNEEMWVNGMYTLSAFGVAIHNAFDKRKIEYIKEPFNIFPKTEAEKEEEKRREKQKLIDWLSRLTVKKKQDRQGDGQNGKP